MKQKEKMEQELLEEQRKNVKEFQRKESDVVWREHLARNRVIQVRAGECWVLLTVINRIYYAVY